MVACVDVRWIDGFEWQYSGTLAAKAPHEVDMTTYVFDAYGTLFDVHAAAAKYAGEIGPQWERMSQLWRTKHLEYTWIHAATGRHTSFRLLAERSLDTAAAMVGGVADGIKPKLLNAYLTLSAYPEVPEVLASLKARGDKLAILTNGDVDMIGAAVASAGLDGMFDAVITVHEIGVFKPAPQVYKLVTDRFSCAPGDISFLSSNRWDVAGGQVFGFSTLWVNRSGAPDEYPDMPAGRVIKDLRALVTI
jgi:2-haloacid dehalogenase